MKKAIIYIHGKNGSADEALHYSKLFPEDNVIGFDYKANTPWEAMEEFPAFFENIKRKHPNIILIANSIGAYFAINSLGNIQIEKAYFVSPIVNMENLIMSMMQWAGVDESQLRDKKILKHHLEKHYLLIILSGLETILFHGIFQHRFYIVPMTTYRLLLILNSFLRKIMLNYQ